MHTPDVVTLRQFYSSPLGSKVRLHLGRAVQRLWPVGSNDNLAGIGFTLPFLRPYLGDASTLTSCMFAQQGAIYWPADAENHSVLGEEASLPFADSSLNRVLALHALEHCGHIATLLDEIYRVLVPGGRALLIVPHRRGRWSDNDHTPFGQGHPYSLTQLRHRAALANLTFVRSDTALYFPVITTRWLQAVIGPWERIGRMLPLRGGVLLMEVEKQLYANIPEPVKQTNPIRLVMPVLRPVPNPLKARQ